MTSTFGAADDLRLRPPRHPVDERAVGYWRLGLVLVTAVPVVACVVPALLVPAAAPPLILAAVGFAAGGGAGAALLPVRWFRWHRWEVTDTAVHARTGWFSRESRLAPMSRVQTVDTRRNPLEQWCGLATLVVTTASSRGAVTIEGLDHELAAVLAARLGGVAEATAGDGT